MKKYKKKGFGSSDALVVYRGVLKVRPSDIPMIKETEAKGNKLTDVWDETKNPNWSDRAQELINFDKARGKESFVLHEGKLHYHFTNW